MRRRCREGRHLPEERPGEEQRDARQPVRRGAGSFERLTGDGARFASGEQPAADGGGQVARAPETRARTSVGEGLVALWRNCDTRVGRPLVLRWPTFSGRLRDEAISGANVQKRSRVADRPAVAKRARQLKPGLGERLVLAGAVSLALFAWGLREIRQAL